MGTSVQPRRVDASGGLSVVFLGRREVAGIRPGCRLAAEGVVGAHHGRLAIVNPVYELLPATSELHPA
jgi:hypothetical protein